MEHSKSVGGYVDASAGRVTFRGFAEAWAARQPHRATTRGGRVVDSRRPHRPHALSRHLELFPADDGLIFHDEKGDPIRRNALGHMWRRAAKRAGVERTPHELRHYAASVLIDRGANVKVVQRHLAHASAKVTLDTYSHLWPDPEDTTMAALEAGLRGVVNDSAAVVGVAR